MSADSRTLQSLLWSTASRCTQALVALISLMVLARSLGPQAWGVFASLAVLVAIAELFVGAAVADALLRRADGRVDHHDAVFCLLTSLAVVLAITLAALAAPLAALLHVGDQAHLLLALALLLPLAAACGIYQSLLCMQGRDSELAIVGAIAAGAASLAGLLAVLADQGLWSLFAIEAVRRLVLLLGMLRLESWRPQTADAFRGNERLFQFNRQVLAQGLLRQADLLIPKALIVALFGASALGCFVIARRILDELTELTTGPLKAVANAAITRSAASSELLHLVIETLYRTAALTVLPVFLALAALAPVLVAVLFGPGWQDTAILLQVLMLMGFAQTTASFNALLLKAAGRADTPVLLFGAGVLVQTLAVPMLAAWGIAGVAAAIALRHLFSWPIELGLVRQALGIGFRAQLRPLQAPFAAAGLMAVLVAASLPLLQTMLAAPLQLLIAAILAIASYLLILWATAPTTVRLGLALTQAMLRRDRLRFNSLLNVVAG